MQLYAAQVLRGTQPDLSAETDNDAHMPSLVSTSSAQQTQSHRPMQASRAQQDVGSMTAAPLQPGSESIREWHLTDDRFIAPSFTAREAAAERMGQAAPSQVRMLLQDIAWSYAYLWWLFKQGALTSLSNS